MCNMFQSVPSQAVTPAQRNVREIVNRKVSSAHMTAVDHPRVLLVDDSDVILERASGDLVATSARLSAP